MSNDLRDALTSPDALSDIRTGVIASIAADGTVGVDFGGGRVIARCACLATYAPATGEAVQVIRRDASSWLVLGATRTSNATTVPVGASLSFPFNVKPAASVAANPLVVSAASSRSWRRNEGWYKPEVYQGAYSTTWGYHRGLYFYGSSAFASLAGQTCTSVTIRLPRTSAGGQSGAEPVYIAPHVHASQPSGSPYFPVAARKFTGAAWGGVVTVTLPADWGQKLIDGVYKGFGLAYDGTTDYAIYQSVAADSTAGRLSIAWS